MDALVKYQIQISKEVANFFDAETKGAKTPFFRETLKILKEYSLRPAKRIRAILIIYGYFIAGGENKKEILKTSVSIELIHNFLLIHDDILDKDDLRRGKTAMHHLYKNSCQFKKNKLHYGSGMAIIAGDMIEFLGRKILDRAKFPTDKKNKVIEKLNQILQITAYGEMFEFNLKDKFESGKAIKEKDILDVYKTKTAFYTFVGPLQMGAILAGTGKELLNKLEKIGTPLGVAFQIQDDLQDFAKDQKEKQPSLAVLKGSKECQKMIKNLINQSKKQIMSANFGKEEKDFLLSLADYILNRKN